MERISSVTEQLITRILEHAELVEMVAWLAPVRPLQGRGRSLPRCVFGDIEKAD